MRSIISVITEDGQYQDQFTNFAIGKSFDNLSSTFSFSSVPGSKDVEIPLKRGQAIEIKINEETIVTGRIEIVTQEINTQKRSITFSCVEKTQDLFKSKLKSATYNTPISLESIIKRTCEDCGYTIVNQFYKQRLGDSTLKIINKAGSIRNFTDEEVQRDDGEGGFDFIKKYLNKRQVFLITDEFGNLVITRAGSDMAPVNINVAKEIQEKNVKYISKTDSEEEIYNTYTIKSQSFGSILGDGAINEQNGTFIDDSVRKTKVCVSVSESSQNSVSASDMAKWQAIVQKARGLTYSITTYGFHQSFNQDTLWKINQIVKVADDETQTYGEFFIKNLSYNQSLGGSETTLILTDKNAYKFT